MKTPLPSSSDWNSPRAVFESKHEFASVTSISWVIADDIADDLRSALEQIEAVLVDLNGRPKAAAERDRVE